MMTEPDKQKPWAVTHGGSGSTATLAEIAERWQRGVIAQGWQTRPPVRGAGQTIAIYGNYSVIHSLLHQ